MQHDEYKALSLVKSEIEIEALEEISLRYLQRTNNMDLAEMLGLEPKGEN